MKINYFKNVVTNETINLTDVKSVFILSDNSESKTIYKVPYATGLEGTKQVVLETISIVDIEGTQTVTTSQVACTLDLSTLELTGAPATVQVETGTITYNESFLIEV